MIVPSSDCYQVTSSAAAKCGLSFLGKKYVDSILLAYDTVSTVIDIAEKVVVMSQSS